MDAFITHTVANGDTLQRLAQRYNVSDWKKIAYLNNLMYPFIDDSLPGVVKQPRIKYLGDQLLIPARNIDSIHYISLEQMERETYGSDLKLQMDTVSSVVRLDSIGELQADVLGDTEIVEGIENLKQALYLRLMTRKGELVLHPEYGSDFLDLVGKKRTLRHIVKIKIEVETAIRQDYRVKDVRNVDVSCVPGGVLVECDIVCVNPAYNFKFSLLKDGDTSAKG